VIGPAELVMRVAKLTGEVPSISAVELPYETEVEAAAIVSHHQPEVDDFLFTGALAAGTPQRLARFVPLNGASLHRVLTQATIAGLHVTRACEAMSVGRPCLARRPERLSWPAASR